MLDEILFQTFLGKNPTITFIPSESDRTRKYYQKLANWYSQFTPVNLLYFDLGEEYDPGSESRTFSSDAIYLSGGDTRRFLQALRQRGFDTKLCDYVSGGGTLIGTSAGSILMCPNINITVLDPNHATPPLADMSALDLVSFEFYPHLNWNPVQGKKDVTAYSKQTDSCIYACNDGDGIIVDGDRIKLIGDVMQVQDGTVSYPNTRFM